MSAQLIEVVRKYNTAETYQKLLEMAAPHIERSPLFGALPYDPSSPIHKLEVVTLEPNPTSVGEIRGLLDLAYPGWQDIILPAFLSRPDLLNELKNRAMIDKSSYSMLLAHERIEDVAFVAAAFAVLMSDFIPYEELVAKMHLVISSIIRPVGAFGEPAAEILRRIGWVHFSFPRTESVRRGGFEDELVDSANRLVRDEIKKAPQRILAVAGPGSVDKVLSLPASMMRRLPERWRERHTTVHIQPVRYGTADLLSGYTLPFAAVFSGPKQFCQIGEMQWVSDLEDVHQMMEWIADERHGRTLVPTMYHREYKTLQRLSGITRL